MINVSGLGSGLDIGGLVDSLVAAERAGSDLQLSRQNAKFQAKFSALGALKATISSFQQSLAGSATLASYNKVTATSSDSASLGVTASNAAIANNYSVEISQLAQSHNLASLAIETDDATEIGTGSITIKFGTTVYDSDTDTYTSFTENTETSSVTVNIDSSNNTLEGIMTAINNADSSVKASIVNDGTGYRLIMTSVETGLSNSIEVTVDDDENDTNLSGLSQLAFNASATLMEQTVAAADANLTINGLSVTHSDNSVETAIDGLTLSLNQISVSPIQVAVKPDTATVKTVVNEFITGYNQFIEVANGLSAFDPDTLQAAPLVGDFTLRSIEGQINNILRSAVDLSPGDSESLVGLGITTTASGTLTLNESTFDEILAQDPTRIIKMFTAFGAPDDQNVSFLSSSDNTVAGNYSVNVTSMATSGFYTGTSALPDFGGGGTVVIDADNDNLTLAIDGVEAAELSLAQGTYTSGTALATELQSRINNSEDFSDSGLTVTVTYDSGTDSLTITSDSVGSTSEVSITAIDTNTPSTIGLIVGSGTGGADIVGTIDGAAATGIGNIMTAGIGTDAEGLQLQIFGSLLGSRGSVNFTKGVGSQLDSMIQQMLEVDGALSDRIDSMEDRIEEISDRAEQLELRWEAVRERYTTQFNALDSLLGQLQNTSTFLEQQLGGLLEPYTGRDT